MQYTSKLLRNNNVNDRFLQYEKRRDGDETKRRVKNGLCSSVRMCTLVQLVSQPWSRCDRVSPEKNWYVMVTLSIFIFIHIHVRRPQLMSEFNSDDSELYYELFLISSTRGLIELLTPVVSKRLKLQSANCSTYFVYPFSIIYCASGIISRSSPSL